MKLTLKLFKKEPLILNLFFLFLKLLNLEDITTTKRTKKSGSQEKAPWSSELFPQKIHILNNSSF